MQAIREIHKVSNGYLSLNLPHSFDNQDVEVIILPMNQVGNDSQEKKVDAGLFGSLHQYANPGMINGEKAAWSDAIEEKHSK